MTNIGFDNILGDEEIFLFDKIETKDIIGGGSIGSSFLLVGIFILAIMTFFFLYFIYPKNAKSIHIMPLQEIMEKIREWILKKGDQFFTYLHIEGETVKKVIV